MSEIDLVESGNKAYKNGELRGIKLRCDGDFFYKYTQTDIERAFLRNAYEKLFELKDSGFTPKPIDIRGSNSSTEIIVEYLGKSEPVTNETDFRRNCALLLWTLKKHNIRHGDITTKNIIVKDNKPMLIDFQQSKFDHEPGPDKRPEGDAHWLWKSALELSPDTSRHIRKWQAIRPFMNHAFLFDLGCSEGDYLLFALSEKETSNMFWGYDHNLDSLEVARDLWPGSGFGFHLTHRDVLEAIVAEKSNVFMLSVYPYIVEKHGKNKTDAFVRAVVSRSAQLFFETQLIGDGPGIHKTDDDVYNMLKQFGKVEKLVTIPVFGREPLARSVWRVT